MTVFDGSPKIENVCRAEFEIEDVIGDGKVDPLETD
jgi:hypothetical protein